ncbi:2,3-bisphosphoglycerate-independent phosphoglycerate mutase [Streptomyces sp. NBC_01808]|uniref:2,3-bisphosphoglycerate-independent phosphoglycerate mutase n=1 Tax=Streptomyces sp. NBC_01808 TaxID=2975947 RepID=UPI002DDBEBCD|nr:2,3-bisphosphoglycerate-independent phosphoglycerate mutase [Streptomyces sp. NBC_01808]WSA41531.1 2,3-bisphosphoglycerate-independent phosphoglycerate mutase [Streptomyces sp. NBC_01808]
MTLSPGILLILDGWGEAAPGPGNAVAAASTPHLDALRARCSSVLLQASGIAVGLPEGVVGNSEIGHLVMGAGRPLAYDSLLVHRQAESGALRQHAVLSAACGRLAGSGRALHVVGLCSDGRIHSDLSHIGELLGAAADAGLSQVWLHAITDGRDVADGTAADYLRRLRKMADTAGTGTIATVIGRNYAMDKSGRRDLTERAAGLIADAVGERTAPDEAAAVGSEGDGWTASTVLNGGPAYPGIVDGDTVLFANFRSDRTTPLVDLLYERLESSGRTRVRLLSLAQYDTDTPLETLVERADASGGLADVLDELGVRSVRIAEHEKFEHVTFFINGRSTAERPCEQHQRVPSAFGPHYVEHPQMNLAEVTGQVIAASASPDIPLVIANLANIDVVGHTGDYEATVRAAEVTDEAVGRICQAAAGHGRWVVLVGDHGNAEQMIQTGADGTVRPYGGHTHNPVPFVLADPDGRRLAADLSPQSLTLPAVAPTVLDLLGIQAPSVMSAPSLLSGAGNRAEHKD